MNQFAHHGGGKHGVDNQMESLSLAEMEDICLRARREIVEGEHLVPLVE